MAMTRSTWIDDDGTGTTGTILNNPELQKVYDNVEAYATPTYGTFTPTDISGANLVFQGGTKGSWSRFDKLIFVWIQIVYPVTSNGAIAKIGGLPQIVAVPVGGSQGYGVVRMWWLQEGAQTVQPMNITTGQPISNAELSGTNNILNAVYRIA